LNTGDNCSCNERDVMTYVILIIVAVVIIGGLYLIRGRRSA
jgi:hypothetical protein